MANLLFRLVHLPSAVAHGVSYHLGWLKILADQVILCGLFQGRQRGEVMLVGCERIQTRVGSTGVVQANNGTPIVPSRESFATAGIHGSTERCGSIEPESAKFKRWLGAA